MELFKDFIHSTEFYRILDPSQRQSFDRVFEIKDDNEQGQYIDDWMSKQPRNVQMAFLQWADNAKAEVRQFFIQHPDKFVNVVFKADKSRARRYA